MGQKGKWCVMRFVRYECAERGPPFPLAKPEARVTHPQNKCYKPRAYKLACLLVDAF